MTKKARAPQQQQNAAEDDSLPGVANVLFGETANTYTLRSGKTLEVSIGKTKHIGLLLELMNVILAKMDQQQMTALVLLFSKRQEALVRKGLDPTLAPAAETSQDSRVQDALDDFFSDESVEKSVQSAFDNGSLLLSLATAAVDVMPRVVGSLSNVSAEEYGDLDIDEGAIVAGTVFMVNYGFFSKNLRPLMRLFIGALQQRASGQKS